MTRLDALNLAIWVCDVLQVTGALAGVAFLLLVVPEWFMTMNVKKPLIDHRGDDRDIHDLVRRARQREKR